MQLSKRPSMLWTLFLLFLLTTQIQESEAGLKFKLKKILKKVLLLKALTGKKGVTIVPLPIPLNLLKDLLKMEGMEGMKMDDMEGMKMDKMPYPEMMMMSPYPMYPSMHGGMMNSYDMMMMPKEMLMPKMNAMPSMADLMPPPPPMMPSQGSMAMPQREMTYQGSMMMPQKDMIALQESMVYPRQNRQKSKYGMRIRNGD